MKKLFAFQKDKNTLKLLLLHVWKKKILLKDYKEYETGAGDKNKTPARQDLAGGVEFIKNFVSDNKALSIQSVCFLPLSSIYVRKITFPYRKISQIKKSIKFAVEPHIPIPVEDTEVFFHPIHAKNNNLEVMAFVIPQILLNEQLELLNSSGLACNEIYLTPLSLFNFFTSHVQIKANMLWLCIEENSTYVFSILKNRQLADLREIPVGRKNLSQEKSELKREISTVLLSQGSEAFGYGIDEIHISGVPVSSQAEIYDWLAKSFNVPIKPIEFNNLLSVEYGDYSFIPEILYASYGRIGPSAINFYPPVLQEKERKGIRISFFLVIFALLILSFRLQFERIIYERKFNLLNSRIKKIFLETFPETKDIRTPLLQFKSRINSLKDSLMQSKSLSLSPLEALREISQRLDKNLQIELDSFKLKEDNITISGSASSSQDIDKIKETLEKSPLFSGVDIEVQRTDKGVTFRLKISPARPTSSGAGGPAKISEK